MTLIRERSETLQGWGERTETVSRGQWKKEKEGEAPLAEAMLMSHLHLLHLACVTAQDTIPYSSRFVNAHLYGQLSPFQCSFPSPSQFPLFLISDPFLF